jgi:hypothetical protein
MKWRLVWEDMVHTFKIGPTEYTPVCDPNLTSKFVSNTIPIDYHYPYPFEPKTGDELIAEMGLKVAECGNEIVPDATKS